jgi:hypothetical protein
VWHRALVLFAVLLGGGALSAAPSAAASPLQCAPTADSSTPAAPSPGKPCWIDMTPYPFGIDGGPVDTTTRDCAPPFPPGRNYNGDGPCYRTVTSIAFRAWNRGLAAVDRSPFGVWLFNGTRWFPDPTFPGPSVCSGNKVLWAGKLDYWLIGSNVCRFDGTAFQWEPLALPPAALAHAPINPDTGLPWPITVTSGACFSWDNCWFFANYGVVVHWDGQVLRDASLGLGATPWLQGRFTAAVARTDTSGNPFAFAVAGTDTGTGQTPALLPPQPDGSSPPQLFDSQGGAFSPLTFSPPTLPQPGDPYRTDLVAVDFGAQGGWVAGNPAGVAIGTRPGPRTSTATQPAPLSRLAADGAAAPCAGYDASTFPFTPANAATLNSGYLWSTISLIPGTGSALIGGRYFSGSRGSNANSNNGLGEPTIVTASCGQPPTTTRFVVPDPLSADPAHAQSIPADLTGSTTTVAANAVNDAWATTGSGTLALNNGQGGTANQRPHLYRLTDGQPPLAPAGDDREPRPSLFTLDPPVYVEPPPTYVTPPSTTTQTVKPSKPKRLKPAVYAVRSKVTRARNGTVTLHISFRIRRPVTLGVEALHDHRVVSSSGLRPFRGSHGELSLTLKLNPWPNQIRFVYPKRKSP